MRMSSSPNNKCSANMTNVESSSLSSSSSSSSTMAESDSEVSALLPKFVLGKGIGNGDYGGASSTRSSCAIELLEMEESSHHQNRREADSHSSSVKSIGMLGSVAIAVNSLAGPAILQLPYQYQRSGIIPTTVCLIFVAVLSNYCSLHMANAVSQIPGNDKFQRLVEFSDPFKEFWSDGAYKLTQVLFFMCSLCMNVAAIVDTTEVVDTIFGMNSRSYAYSFDRSEVQSWTHSYGPCTSRQSKLHLCTPFSDEAQYGDYIFTLGYLITTTAFLPICLMDLKENTSWQIMGFLIFMSVSMFFVLCFCEYPMSTENVSMWGETWDDILGVIMFNFSLVLAIPAWLHDKKENIDVKTVVVGSTVISTFVYVGVGILGALAIPRVSVNMLSPMVTGAYGASLQYAASIFAFFIIGLDIPLFSVLTRYNLTHSGMCSERTANIVVVWIPWLTSWMLYQGDRIGIMLSWGGVLFTSLAAFILPLYVALRVLVTTDQVGSVSVYGKPLDRRTQIKLLYALLFVAGAAVTIAVGGKIAATERKENYLHSQEYLNSTSASTLTLPANADPVPKLRHPFSPGNFNNATLMIAAGMNVTASSSTTTTNAAAEVAATTTTAAEAAAAGVLDPSDPTGGAN